jgi:hypothetical protein
MELHGIFISPTTKEIAAYWRGTLIASLKRSGKDQSATMTWARAVVETISGLGTPDEVLDFVI